LTRWLTEVEWDVQALQARRLAWRQLAPQTRDSVRGVMASDKTLVEHAGTLLADGGWLWEHADQRHLIAHDDRRSHDVCAAGAHAPSAWRRFKQRDTGAAGTCKDHPALCSARIEEALRRERPGAFPFDSSGTSAKVLPPMQRTQRAAVGALQRKRQVV
jgi:hypothetical protein